MSERDTLRVEMTEARNQISVCEEELGRALSLASEFRRKVGIRRLYSGVLSNVDKGCANYTCFRETFEHVPTFILFEHNSAQMDLSLKAVMT